MRKAVIAGCQRRDANRRLRTGCLVASLCMALALPAWSAPEPALAPADAAVPTPRSMAGGAEASPQESIESLRQRIELLQREADTANRGLSAVQARLTLAEEERRNRELLALALAVLGIIAIGLFLFERGRRRAAAGRTRDRVGGALESAHIAPDVPIDVDSDFPPDLPLQPARAPTRHGGAPGEAAATAAAAFVPMASEPALPVDLDKLDRTVACVARAAAPAVERATLSADDLIDLDQQSEFFLALGDEEAAISLLEDGLSGPTAGCPLPYLRLLTIHRRRGDREAHEQVRARYERRFETAPASWSEDAAPVLNLEDEHEVMRQIESVWSDRGATMRLIESWLIPNGAPTVHLGVEALSQLQFLYLQARAAADLDARPEPDVDLLLPLSTSKDLRSVVTESLPVSRPVAFDQASTDVDFELDFPSETPPPTRS